MYTDFYIYSTCKVLYIHMCIFLYIVYYMVCIKSRLIKLDQSNFDKYAGDSFE